MRASKIAKLNLTGLEVRSRALTCEKKLQSLHPIDEALFAKSVCYASRKLFLSFFLSNRKLLEIDFTTFF